MARATKGPGQEPKVEPKEEFTVKSDHDKVMRHTSLLQSDIGAFGLKLVANSSEDSTMDRKPVFQPLMESAKVLSPSKGSTRPQKGVPHCRKLEMTKNKPWITNNRPRRRHITFIEVREDRLRLRSRRERSIDD